MGKYLRMFRRIVHKVITILKLQQNKSDESSLRESVYILLSKTNDIGGISNDFKMKLLKPPDSRTREEILTIAELAHKFKYFKHFPEDVIHYLAQYFSYCCLTSNRIIYRKGNVARNIYFLLSGQCIVSDEECDPVTKEYAHFTIIKGGSSFGDDEVFQNTCRTSTVATISLVELLVLEAEDFFNVFENTMRRNWEIMDEALKHFTYFDTFNASTRRECFLVSKVLTYEKGQTILSSNVGRKDVTHFILSGECQVVEHIFVKHKVQSSVFGKSLSKMYFSQSTGNKTMKRAFQEPSEAFLRSDKSISSFYSPTRQGYYDKTSSKVNQETVCLPSNTDAFFMQVCIYSELACFNIGENMKNRSVVSLTPVTCLLIPKYWLQTNIPNLCSKIKIYLNSRLPTNDEVYDELLKQRKYRQYKKELLSGLLKNPPCNSYMNIPYSIRIRQDFNYNNTLTSNKRNESF